MPSAFGVRSAIDRTVPYDIAKNFTGVAQMARSPSFMVVSTQHGFKSLKDLIAYAKAQTQGVFYSTAGVGSTAHLHAAAVAHLAGFKAEHAPQRGTPEAVTEAMTASRFFFDWALISLRAVRPFSTPPLKAVLEAAVN